MKIIAYRTHGKKFFNSDEYTIKNYNKNKIILIDDNSSGYHELEIEMKLINHFKPAFALTVHKSQGMTINKPYSIYEYDKMKHDMLYVCLTRTKEKQYVNFCDMSMYRPFKPYIYIHIITNRILAKQ